MYVYIYIYIYEIVYNFIIVKKSRKYLSCKYHNHYFYTIIIFYSFYFFLIVFKNNTFEILSQFLILNIIGFYSIGISLKLI